MTATLSTPDHHCAQGVVGSMALPEIVLGGASISAHYNTDVHLNSGIPLRTVRLALRCVRSGPTPTRFLTRSTEQIRYTRH